MKKSNKAKIFLVWNDHGKKSVLVGRFSTSQEATAYSKFMNDFIRKNRDILNDLMRHTDVQGLPEYNVRVLEANREFVESEAKSFSNLPRFIKKPAIKTETIKSKNKSKKKAA